MAKPTQWIGSPRVGSNLRPSVPWTDPSTGLALAPSRGSNTEPGEGRLLLWTKAAGRTTLAHSSETGEAAVFGVYGLGRVC